ncbi:MAG: hypothetical protein V4723_19595 [Pseudomonadota bacterium]
MEKDMEFPFEKCSDHNKLACFALALRFFRHIRACKLLNQALGARHL